MIYVLLILLGFATRFLPHPANFTAVGAIALFSGYYVKNKKLAVALPLAIMVLSDWKIGFYQWQLITSVYLSFVVVVLLGIFLRRRRWFFALPTSLLCTVIFFLITNWAVWQFTVWYPHNYSGLIACYAAGLPFIKNSFLGDFVYTLGLFSIAQLATLLAKRAKSKLSFVENAEK